MASRMNARVRLACGVSAAVIAAAIAGTAAAQTAPADTASTLDTVVVTGTRIPTGFTTPTPVTVTTAEALLKAAPNSMAEGLAVLPAFGNSSLTANPGNAINGSNGQALLNLRGLGSNRNLILLDGRRMVATATSGGVDINALPQNLVSRVDVVTGGASAAYGSDAVAGVVNFVLDTKYQGFKAEARTGISTYGDLPSSGVSAAWGTAFAGDRGHLVLSAEYFVGQGVGVHEDTHRAWFESNPGLLANPVTGARPTQLVVADLRSSQATPGGLISTGPLRGLQFLPGGQTSQLKYGSLVGTTFMAGGEGATTTVGLAPNQNRATAFGHVLYDLTDNLSVYAEGLLSREHVVDHLFYTATFGAGTGFTIFNDNPYLPASVVTQMAAAKVSTILVGRYNFDFPSTDTDDLTRIKRFAGGFNAKFGSDWRADGYVTYGQMDQDIAERNLVNLRHLYAAVDSAKNATGQIVCRSTLSGLDPGCVPLNIFGAGSPSPEAIKYVTGAAASVVKITQAVAALNLSGTLGDFQVFGAGPIGVAAGAEYRKETADQTTDAVSRYTNDATGVRGFPASQVGRLGGYNLYNPQPLSGSYSVKEVYGEAAVPLLRDAPIAKSLEATLAVRYADYNLSGGATTWKWGFNYEVNDQLRLRLTQSRDIRAPNLVELFTTLTQSQNTQTLNGVTYPSLILNSGNPNLKPERATTLTYGAVYRPSFVPGLQASLDYFKINIVDAIGTLGSPTTLCSQGFQLACSQITITPTNTLIVRGQQLNLSRNFIEGFDGEVAYSMEAFGGRLTFRGLVNHLMQAYSIIPPNQFQTRLNEPANPKWRGLVSINYARDKWSVSIQERLMSNTLLNATQVQGIEISDNHLPAMAYTNLNTSYKLDMFGHNEELFFNVQNLFNTDPPVSPNIPTNFNPQPVQNVFERLGRLYTVGVRVKW